MPEGIRNTRRFVSRDVRDFPCLASAIEAFCGWLRPVERGIGSFHLFGGFIRGHLLSERCRDIDIVAGSSEDRARLLRLAGTPFTLEFHDRVAEVVLDVNQRVFQRVEEVLDRTDFTVTQAVYSYPSHRLHVSPELFEHGSARVLVVNPLTGELPLHCLWRIYRFVDQGYHCRCDSLEEVLRQYGARPVWRVWAEALLHIRSGAANLVP